MVRRRHTEESAGLSNHVLPQQNREVLHRRLPFNLEYVANMVHFVGGPVVARVLGRWPRKIITVADLREDRAREERKVQQGEETIHLYGLHNGRGSEPQSHSSDRRKRAKVGRKK